MQTRNAITRWINHNVLRNARKKKRNTRKKGKHNANHAGKTENMID